MKYEVHDPLFFGLIWDKYFLDNKLNGLKKYNFKRINKAKKNHRYRCEFWNNRLDLTIDNGGVAFEPYNIQKENIILSNLFMGAVYTKKDIEFFVKTMKKIHKAIKIKKENCEIEKYDKFELIKTYTNNAFEFERTRYKDEFGGTKDIVVFWDNKSGGVINLIKTNEMILKSIPEIEMSNGNYFPIVKKGLQVPIGLLEEILKEMKEME